MDAILSIDNIRVSYGRFNVLHELSFEVPNGEVLGVIGPNGAGKTTLMNAIIGLVIPTEGAIIFDKCDITKITAYKRCRMGIGRTYQVPLPFENMTVYENTLVGAVQGAGKSEKQSKEHCVEMLRLTGLHEKRNLLAGRLELLDRKRLEIARALATEPKLLLLDEVSAGLTDAEIGYMIELVARLKESGITIIWIEHIIKTMAEATDTLLCLAGGTKLIHGSPKEVLESKEVLEIYLGAEENEQYA